MGIIENDTIFDEMILGLNNIEKVRKQQLVMEPFEKDFSYRLCWNSNAIEGNTLSLDETISVVEYDEVRTGHSFTEYEEAKRLYRAIKELLSFDRIRITEAWIARANSLITGIEGTYRTKNVYIGTLAEATYYPPNFKEIPDKMEKYLKSVNFEAGDLKSTVTEIASQHILFERIHPYEDGNGRTGRLILNQQLINQGLLPITIEEHSKYRQAFRMYDRNQDLSLMVHLICKGELASARRIELLDENMKKGLGEPI